MRWRYQFGLFRTRRSIGKWKSTEGADFGKITECFHEICRPGSILQSYVWFELLENVFRSHVDCIFGIDEHILPICGELSIQFNISAFNILDMYIRLFYYLDDCPYKCMQNRPGNLAVACTWIRIQFIFDNFQLGFPCGYGFAILTYSQLIIMCYMGNNMFNSVINSLLSCFFMTF